MKRKPWQTIEDMTGIHVVPVDDLLPHDLSRTCRCAPEVTLACPENGFPYVSPLFLHNSIDGRELFEPGSPFYEPPRWNGVKWIVAGMLFLILITSLFL